MMKQLTKKSLFLVTSFTVSVISACGTNNIIKTNPMEVTETPSMPKIFDLTDRKESAPTEKETKIAPVISKPEPSPKPTEEPKKDNVVTKAEPSPTPSPEPKPVVISKTQPKTNISKNQEPVKPLLDKVLYFSDKTGNLELFTMNVDGSMQTQLTNNLFDDSVGHVSNNKIVWASNQEDNNFEIFTMNNDGSKVQRLTSNKSLDGNPRFSFDGSKIVFTSNRDGNSEIYVMNADGTNQVRLTENKFTDSKPAFSPDGSKIVFSSNRDGNSEIYLMNFDGTNQVRLTFNTGEDNIPVFSLNNKIAFSSNRDGNSEIYVMNDDGSSQRRITENAFNDRAPYWSSDNTKLFFERDFNGIKTICSININGSSESCLNDGKNKLYPVIYKGL